MELLINRLMGVGCDRRRLVAKAFGGASFFRQDRETAVGARNIAFVRRFLGLERIPLVAERLGGERALKVNFYTDTSRVTVSVVRSEQSGEVAGSERSWKSTHPPNCVKNDITLF